MISIARHIRYLLMHHDCVVVPGLGAFMVQTVPARFNADSGEFLPPCKSLGFNSEINHDDALLATSIARVEGVPFDEARGIVANEVEQVFLSLAAPGGECEFPKVGTLSADASGALVFTPAANSVADWRYAGLFPVRVAVPAVEETDDTPEVPEPQILHVDFSRRARRWGSIAASVAVLLGIGFVASTPVAVERGQLDYASISAPSVKEKTVAAVQQSPRTIRTIVCPRPVWDTEATAIADTVSGKAVQPFIATGKNKAAKITDWSPRFSHYLIVASCESRKKALRYIKNRPGQGLGLVEAEGRYRVYIAASDSREAVELPKSNPVIASRYPDAWVFTAR